MLGKKLLIIFGSIITLFSSACVIIALLQVLEIIPQHSGAFSALIFLGITNISGIIMIIRGFAIPKKIKRKIINLAQKSGGEISISEVVAELNLTTRQSKKALNKIVKEGHANERKSPTRGVLYRFPGLIKNDLEQNMYEIIKSMGGKVTAFDLSQKTGQSIEESRKILDYFVKIGEAEIRIAQNAIEVYEFKGVLSKKQKNQSETII